jgi:hypothetical protein
MKKLRIVVLLGAAAAGIGLYVPALAATASAPAPVVRGSVQNDLPPCLPPHARSMGRVVP